VWDLRNPEKLFFVVGLYTFRCSEFCFISLIVSNIIIKLKDVYAIFEYVMSTMGRKLKLRWKKVSFFSGLFKKVSSF